MGDEQFSNDNPIRTSKYNSAIAQLYRIDQLWQDAHRHARSGELMKWNWDLDRVWCELAADAEKGSDEEFNEFLDRIAKARTKPNELYHILLEKEIFLRRIQNKQGKGTAYQESVDEYMDG